MSCHLYPCFDITSGKIEKGKEVKWVCGACEGFGCADKKMKVIEKFSLKTKMNVTEFKEPNMGKARAAVKTLKALDGLGKAFLVMTASDKKKVFEIESSSALSNVGVLSCLMRDITIVFSHNSRFRAPPLPEVLLAGNGMIIGEQTNVENKNYSDVRTDELVLPPIPFPEIIGENVCSSSPSQELDKWVREKIDVNDGDATLLLGFDLK